MSDSYQFHDAEREEFICRIMTYCYVWSSIERHLKSRKWFEKFLDDIFNLLDLSDEDLQWLISVGLNENYTKLYFTLFDDESIVEKIYAVHVLADIGYNISELNIEDMPNTLVKKLYMIRFMRHICKEFIERCEDYSERIEFLDIFVKAAAASYTYDHFKHMKCDDYSLEDMIEYYNDAKIRFDHARLVRVDELPPIFSSHVKIVVDHELGYYLAPN